MKFILPLVFMLSLLLGTTEAAHVPGNSGPVLAEGLGETRTGSSTFNTLDLLATSVRGMLDDSCGGYCVIGACAHFNVRIRVSLLGGIRIELYTIISPQLRHPLPDLLVSSYTHPGDEPYNEWRATFGAVISTASNALGIAGGRPNPTELDRHQSGSTKEVDIIGHPMAALPQMLSRGNGGALNTGPLRNPSFRRPASFQGVNTGNGNSQNISFDSDSDGESEGIDVEAMIESAVNGAVAEGMSVILEQYDAALRALQLLDIINDIEQIAAYFTAISDLMDAISLAAEAGARGTILANLTNPRFQMPRMLCPSTIKPLQPYYLSFVDAFWWRTGFPITDGPFSGSNRSMTILNPFSSDTLPPNVNRLNPMAEIWGNMYPREGMVNQNHDAKTASILAWRAMDVLQNSIPGSRIGIPLPTTPTPRGSSVGNPRWQMIYPEMKSCQSTPYYPPESLLTDFMEPNVHGGYAWNYYRTYTCCSNNVGRHLGSVRFPIPLCITMSAVSENAEQRATN